MVLACCTMMDEQSSRGGQTDLAQGRVPNRWQEPVIAAAPDTYRFRLWQMGGTGILNTSMGTSLTFDNQISFKDAMQTIAAVASSVATFKAAAAAEITNRFKAGQLTVQQKNVLDNQLANVQSQNDLTKFLAGLEAMKTAP